MKYFKLGYDVRIYSRDYFELEWDVERRKIFLLNSNTERPFSIDTNVWASYFNFVSSNTSVVGKILEERRKYFKDREVVLIPEDNQQAFLNLWMDPNKMKDCFIDKKNKNRDEGVMIYVDALFEERIFSDESWKMVLENSSIIKQKPNDWLFLGFDIADTARLSGLMNCGYEEEKNDLIKKWSHRLNENGLLQTESDALEFRDMTNKRVEEHAPFDIYRLFRAPIII